MSALVVTAHPDPASLTHEVARRLRERLPGARTAHLAQEGFDPRFTMADRRPHLGEGDADPAVVAEQRRVDAATDVVLVFPLWWWSVPALLKGWVDRVFVAGWAFDADGDGVRPRLQHLTVHLLPVAGTSDATRERHGYTEALRTQLEHGVLDYCGARRGLTTYLEDTGTRDVAALAEAVERAVEAVAAAGAAGPGGSDGQAPATAAGGARAPAS